MKKSYNAAMKHGRKLLLILGDIGALVLSFFITVFIRGLFSTSQNLAVELCIPFLVAAFICVIALYALDLYDLRFVRPASSNLWRSALVFIVSPILSIVLFYWFDFFTIAPRVTLVIFFIAFALLFILWRRTFYRIFSTSFKNKTIVWGGSQSARHLFHEMARNLHRGYEPLMYIESIDELTNALTHHTFQLLVLDNHIEIPDPIIKIILNKKIAVRGMEEMYEDILQKTSLETIHETSFLHHVQHYGTATKIFYRIFEYLVAIPLLIVMAPFLILAIIGIKLEDRGSLFFKQPRMGYLGEEFMLYKFRTMTEEHRRKSTGTDWTTKNDPRVTRIGKILRVLHIDEIPQMINVLKGDITLVGPRPDVMRVELDLKQRIPHYHLRHTVKPGFTGWAQIKYHAANDDASFIERFQYDLYYIKNKNFFFDIGIMLRTLQIIFSHII